MNRRQVLRSSLYLAASSGMVCAAEPSLASLAAAKGFFYGSATQAQYLGEDVAFADLIQRECACLVTEWDMKWQPLQPALDGFDTNGMDHFVQHAERMGLWIRGHTLFWHQSLPDWFDAELQSPADWERVVVPYAIFVGERYGAKLRHWDVINEGIHPEDGRRDRLRKWKMTKIFGNQFPQRAFELAHQVAPHAKLFYNDYGLEYDDKWFETRRTAVLKSLTKWRRDGIPVHGFGIQSHLTAHGKSKINQMKLNKFFAEISGLGLEIVVSELDVRETKFDLSVAKRDQAVADETRRFLDVALDQKAVTGVVTWGCTDRYSWLKSFHDPRNRGLPFDEAFVKKPMWDAIAGSIKAAPERKNANG